VSTRLIRVARRAALLTAAVAAILPVGAAHAALIETDPCDDSALTQSFKRWGDPAYYKLAPGGDFENGLAGMAVRGNASIVSESEPWGVTGKVGSKALKLAPGASVTLPATCVNAGNPSYRFFTRSSGGLLGLLPLMKVELVYRDSLLGLVALPLGTALPSSGWQPSLPMLTASAVAAAISNGEDQLSLRFTSITGTWKIDDVLVDPYRRA